jgi:hypothetical protein
MKEVKFVFNPPSPYEETGEAGDKLWDELMPSKLTEGAEKLLAN